MPNLQGVAASPGVGVGRVWVHDPGLPRVADDPVEDVDAEVARVGAALEAVADDLQERSEQAEGEAVDILEAQAMMAGDPALAEAATKLVRERRLPAARAVLDAGESYALTLAASSNEYLAARAADIRDVAARVARRLLGIPDPDLGGLTEPVVVVADDLAPADTARIDPALVLAVATQQGSRTSHTAILARSLGVPAVVAVQGLTAAAAHGAEVIVDGDAGAVILDPAPEQRAEYARRVDEQARRAQEAAAGAAAPGATRDGHRVELAANVGSVAELRAALAAGAEGVGLLRTELLYLNRQEPPSLDEQASTIAEMVTLLAGKRLVVRTFDFGADKPIPFIDLPPGPNPALGVRGVRLAKHYPDLLDEQLRAIVQAASAGPVAVMAPMVGTVEEAAWFAERVRAAGGDDARVEVGVMVEVPSAVLVADALAAHLDFLSIGTNDLTQYLHAADRQEGRLAALQDPFGPAVLRSVARICEAATPRGTWVGVCGEAGGDPGWALLAVGLGVSELSMGAGSLPAVRSALAAHTLDECRAAAQRALEAVDAAEARRLVPS